VSDRNGKIFCTSIASLSHISKYSGSAASRFGGRPFLQGFSFFIKKENWVGAFYFLGAAHS